MSSREALDIFNGNKPVVFTFPGQGAYHFSILRELYISFPETHVYFQQADGITQRFLQHAFLPLATAPTQEAHDAILRICPDLDQIGIYLTEVCIATLLMRAGVKPDLLVGHSLGELAALTIAGAYSIETGFKIVCQRVLALQDHGSSGRMAAVSCDSQRAQELINKAGKAAVEISVINHPRQTVLSGTVFDLQELNTIMSQHGICLTLLKSRYPFHSRFLQEAVRPFRNSLAAHEFQAAAIPVFLCTEERLLAGDVDLVETLSSQFVRTLNFRNIVEYLYTSGRSRFIECGAGDIVTKLVMENLKSIQGIVCLPVAPVDKGVKGGLKEVLKWAAEENIIGPALAPLVSDEPPAQRVQQLMSTMMANLSVLVQNMSTLVENTSALMQLAARTGLNGSLQNLPDAKYSAPLTQSHSTLPSPEHHERASVGVSEVSAPSAMQADTKRTQEKDYPAEYCPDMPIAIVSLGCVLPGASSPEEYWENVKNGVSGIIDLAEIDPTTAQDFLAGSVTDGINIVPDKTYTLLNGTILDIPYDAALLSGVYARDEFNQLTRGQRLLALAIAQGMSRLRSNGDRRKMGKIQCILGATADGSAEYDEALFLDSVQTVVQGLDEPQASREMFSRVLQDTLGYKTGDSRKLTQHKIYQDVVHRFLSQSCRTYVVDSACSSSLYSINLGIKALRNFESDIVMAGGVFAAGPANNTLFAQFRGLTPKQSRPLDEAADGVVFGDGAAVVVLKRLSDALAAGDIVVGVIRGMGLSSDGKSPSINVPQSKGQSLAMRKAYESARIDLGSVQYVEAHATATPVGDAVEFSALKEVMQDRDATLPPVEVGSVKALVGHTGWVSGVASVIKICKMFEERIIPKQYNYRAPSKEFGIENSPFTISTQTHPWPLNIHAFPRRAGVNGFGFGGTNAHIVLEEFDEAYHRNLCAQVSPKKLQSSTLAVVGVGGLFPATDKLDIDRPVDDRSSKTFRFRRDQLRLPAKKLLLPDVREHMDVSQYLAALAAEKIFATMPDHWQGFKDAIGVVLGLESKTERGARANERIYLDRMRRLVTLRDASKGVERILNKLSDRIRTKNIPSGAYTLPGLMPNVTASRITHMFDLKGPNIVVDMGSNSLFQALLIAQQFLVHNDCQMVLAGGINAAAGEGEAEAEAAVVLALMTEEMARQEGMPILAILDTSSADAVSADKHEIVVTDSLNYESAQGGIEILRAIAQVGTQKAAFYVNEPGQQSSLTKRFTFSPGHLPEKRIEPKLAPLSTPQTMSETHAYIQDTAIYCYTPMEVEEIAVSSPVKLTQHRILFLTDQPKLWLELERSGALNGLQYHVISHDSAGLKNALSVDLASEESIASSLQALSKVSYDTIVAVKDMHGRAEDTLLLNKLSSECIFLDLLFVVTRHAYESIRLKHTSLSTLCLNAYRAQQLDAYTGLVAGFMKSTARELPESTCRIINTDEGDFRKALRFVETEMAHGQAGSEVEVCYRAGKRYVVKLHPVQDMAQTQQAYLDSNSVIIATGGGRGVTAVLAEELLNRFGCTVIAIGRTDIASAPDTILNMDQESFRGYEPLYYKEELAKDKTKKIVELKRQYNAYQAINEVNQTIKRLQALPGRFEYLCMDINDEQAVEKLVNSVYGKYDRLDLVLHGAGIQISKMLTKKSLKDFRNIVATKIASLGYFYRTCEKHRSNRPVHFHILTSAFSYMGNDGQPDYGAANEAMNRLAADMNRVGRGAYWSTLAWLGWAGIGMTRGSEYAALAASRNLRGVTKEEGQEIFSSLLAGPPAAPINILLADGEIDFYKIDIQVPEYGEAISQIGKNERKASSVKQKKQDFHLARWDVSLENAIFLNDHVVNGIATAPAAFLTTLVAETAHQLRPDLKILSFENTQYHKFVRVPAGRGIELRLSAQVMSETASETAIQIQVRSDFVHKNGSILQRDILHKETIVRMAKALRPAPLRPIAPSQVEGLLLPDPYVMEGSPVQLNGQFNSMVNIRVGVHHRKAEYQLRRSSYPDFRYRYLLPNLIMVDSFWRFGAVHVAANGTLPLYVPEECAKMNVYFDFTDFNSPPLMQRLIFSGENPSGEGDLLRLGNIEVIDQAGNILLMVEGAVCRRFGEIKHALTA